MHYVSVEGLTKSYGIKPLFNNISFHVNEGDRIALIARNGWGKSTLLKILAGKETPDEGKTWINKEVDVVLLEQDPLFMEDRSILDNIFFHDHPMIRAIKDFEAASEEEDPEKLNHALAKMDELGAWNFDARVKQVLTKLNIHHLLQPVNQLSGGQRKRVALAKTLIDIGFEHKHVLLMMDEPTNHLDVEMVEWLEYFLEKENLTLLMVTHDRYFLDAVCGEIWELNGDILQVYKGDYENYLARKAHWMESEQSSIDKARNTYRRELEWMRKQPRARTTKSKSRQDRFYSIEKKAKERMVDDQVQLNAKMSRLGGKVIELKKVVKKFDDRIILKGFDYTFKKGERVGIAGKNGSGKTTFVEILQGIQQADSGKVNVGDTVVFGNYSQKGLVVKEDMRVIEYVKNIAEHFPLADGGSMSAGQFLELFLFDPEKQYTFISKLSGGERRRLHLLAVLFRNPNFLILDEPTNDLDLPTLSVLENFLFEFSGCLVIVSHDRYFMDRLIDHLFVFEGNGVIIDFPGNYSQYRVWAKERDAGIIAGPEQKPAEANIQQDDQKTFLRKRQLSFKERRELELLEKELKVLATEKQRITERLHQEGVPFDELQTLSLRIGEVTELTDRKELRWLELSELAS